MIVYKYIIFIMNILLLRANIFNHECKSKRICSRAIAAATYGMNPLFALPLYKAGMNPDSVLFFRYLFAIPVLGIMIKAERAGTLS